MLSPMHPLLHSCADRQARAEELPQALMVTEGPATTEAMSRPSFFDGITAAFEIFCFKFEDEFAVVIWQPGHRGKRSCADLDLGTAFKNALFELYVEDIANGDAAFFNADRNET